MISFSTKYMKLLWQKHFRRCCCVYGQQTAGIDSYLQLFVCVCVCVCVCVRLFTRKTSSVCTNWNFSEQINNVMLKAFLSYAKSPHCYFTMKYQTFLTSHFILFTHQKQAERLTFKTEGLHLPLSGIARAPHNIISRSISGVRHSREGSQSNLERLSNYKLQY